MEVKDGVKPRTSFKFLLKSFTLNNINKKNDNLEEKVEDNKLLFVLHF